MDYSSPTHPAEQTDGWGPNKTTPYSLGLDAVLGAHGGVSHRQRIVAEVFDTEHSYISQLTTIVTLFLEPIRVGGLLPAATCSLIFSNIEAILSVNQELFVTMRRSSLAEAFSQLGPFLKLYSTYAENYQRANKTLQDCLRDDSQFCGFVSSMELRPECCGLRLSSLLITPVQRVPRYKLLLADLLKHTKLTHTDYEKLKGAVDNIAIVTSHINEFIRKHENFQKMLSIQCSLTGDPVPSILSPARSFLREGRLMKVSRRYKHKRPVERMLFLFSDILVYCKPSSGGFYECRCVLPLLSCTSRLSTEHAPPGVHTMLEVANDDKSLLLFTADGQEVTKWAEILEQAIRELQQTFSQLLVQQSAVVQSDRSTEEEHTEEIPYPLTATLFSPGPKDRHGNSGGTHISTEPLNNESGCGQEGDGCDERDQLITTPAHSPLSSIYSLGDERTFSRCCAVM